MRALFDAPHCSTRARDAPVGARGTTRVVFAIRRARTIVDARARTCAGASEGVGRDE